MNTNTTDSASTEQTPNAVTLAALEAAEKGEGLSGPFDNAESLMESLNE